VIKKVTIRTKIFFIVLVAIIPTIGVSLYSAHSFLRLYLVRNKTQIETVCNGFVNEQRFIARNAEEMMLAISQTRSVQNKEYTVLNVYLGDLMKQYPSYSVILAADANFNVIASGVNKINYSLEDRAYLQKASKTECFSLGHYIVSKSTGVPSVTYTLPVTDRAGDVIYLIATYALESYLDEMSLAGLPQNMLLEIFDDSGRRLFFAGNDDEMPLGENVSPPLYERAISKETEVELLNINNSRFFVSTNNYSRCGTNIYVSMRVPYRHVFFQSYIPVISVLIVMLLSSIGAGFISVFMARRLFVARIEKLTEYTLSLAGGNLSVRSGLNTARDEVTDLMESFNSMAKALEERSNANQRSLREKEFLLTELQKRVSDNLQLLSSIINLQIDHAEGEESRISLKTTHSRVMALALVYETIHRYSDVQEVHLHRYCNGLCEYLFSLYANVGTEIHCDVCGVDFALPIDKALPLALIINELVSNSLMHAFQDKTTGSIGLFFEIKSNGIIVMTISDDGVGFEWNPSEYGTLGFEMVSALVEQIHGTMAVESGPEGSRVRIQFPMD